MTREKERRKGIKTRRGPGERGTRDKVRRRRRGRLDSLRSERVAELGVALDDVRAGVGLAVLGTAVEREARDDGDDGELAAD